MAEARRCFALPVLNEMINQAGCKAGWAHSIVQRVDQTGLWGQFILVVLYVSIEQDC
jgi:hypothetical protein